MSRLLLLLAWGTSLGGCYSDEDVSILTSLPDIVGEMCPGVNVCHENQTSRAPEKAFPPGYESCCTECSCGSNCEEKGNCCFPNKVSFQNQDNRKLEVLGKGLVCIFPTTDQPIKDRMNYRSYYMVSSLPGHGYSCGEETVAPWGSLYPVYSPKRKLIYKNIACASTDGVTDGVIWDAILDCDSVETCNFISWSDLNSINDTAVVDFVYPGNINDIRPSKCFVEPPIDTCPQLTEFHVPYETGLSSEDVIRLCTSKFISPYRGLRLYANVFCSICNKEYFSRKKMCTKVGILSYGSRGSRARGFTGMIDGRLLNEARINKFQEVPEIPLACDISNASRCRPIVCPSPQLRDRTGKCAYLNKIWYDQVLTVHINLTTEQAVNISEVFGIEFGHVTRILPALKSPWTKFWSIDIILNELMDGYKNRTTLFVAISNIKSAVQIKSLLKNVRKMVTQDWLLQHNNSTIVFKSTFMSLLTINAAEDSSKSVPSNHSGIPPIPQYILLYQRTYFHDNLRMHLITKLYMCTQVELWQSDFILTLANTVLFNTITQRFMFDGEFALVPSSTFGVRARICIEDSGMYKQGVTISKGFCVNRSLRLVVTALLCGVLYHVNLMQFIFGV